MVSVYVRNGEIAASGPDVDSSNVWWVHMILRVPRRANLELASANGGIAVRNMLGHVTARATNGGISLASCAGQNRLMTGSGGVSPDPSSRRTQGNPRNHPLSLPPHPR